MFFIHMFPCQANMGWAKCFWVQECINFWIWNPKLWLALPCLQYIAVTVCQNDKLSSSLTWLDCLQINSEGFILLAESNQILLRISFILIPLNFMYLVALLIRKLSCKQSQDMSNLNSTCDCDRKLQHIFSLDRPVTKN